MSQSQNKKMGILSFHAWCVDIQKLDPRWNNALRIWTSAVWCVQMTIGTSQNHSLHRWSKLGKNHPNFLTFSVNSDASNAFVVIAMSFGVYRPQMGVANGMRILCSDQTLQEISAWLGVDSGSHCLVFEMISPPCNGMYWEHFGLFKQTHP